MMTPTCEISLEKKEKIEGGVGGREGKAASRKLWLHIIGRRSRLPPLQPLLCAQFANKCNHSWQMLMDHHRLLPSQTNSAWKTLPQPACGLTSSWLPPPLRPAHIEVGRHAQRGYNLLSLEERPARDLRLDPSVASPYFTALRERTAAVESLIYVAIRSRKMEK